MADQKKLDQAVAYASYTFWEEIAKSFPHVKTGDLDPETETKLATVQKEAVLRWLQLNDKDEG